MTDLAATTTTNNKNNNTTTTTTTTTTKNNNTNSNIEERLPPLPVLPLTSKATLHKCRHFSAPSPDNEATLIFIASFPKSGTTWMQNIVLQLLLLDENETENEHFDFQHVSDLAPFYEIDHHWQASDEDSNEFSPAFDWSRLGSSASESASPSRRRVVFNTHLYPHMLPPPSHHPNHIQMIYVTRHPLDVVTSFYHHMSNQHPDDGGFTGTLTEFCKTFQEGTLAYGKWSHHVAAWMERMHDHDHKRNTIPPSSQETKNSSNPSNILWVRYEDLKANRQGEIQRIAQFLNVDWTTAQRRERVLERTSFDHMREHAVQFQPISVRWNTAPPGDTFNFIRQGRVGDYQNLLTQDQQGQILKTIVQDWKTLYGGGGDGDDGESSPSSLPKWTQEFLSVVVDPKNHV